MKSWALWSIGLSIDDIASNVARETTLGLVLLHSLKFARSSPKRAGQIAGTTSPSTGGASDDNPGPADPPGVLLENLRYDHCRWPIGDPHDADFCYCGKQKGNKSRYCDEHHKIAYRPASEIILEDL